MTSAAVPGLFSYVNLPVRADPGGPANERRFVHLFDGGNADNLGLTSAQIRCSARASPGERPGIRARWHPGKHAMRWIMRP